MDEKKGFLLFHDSYEIVSELSDEQAGKLLKAIFDYSINGKEIITDDGTLRIVFKMIKNSLERNLDKYERVVEIRNKKARIGGIIRALKDGNRISNESIKFLSETNIGQEYLRRQGVSEEVIVSVWEALKEIEPNDDATKINCHKVKLLSVTKVSEL